MPRAMWACIERMRRWSAREYSRKPPDVCSGWSSSYLRSQARSVASGTLTMAANSLIRQRESCSLMRAVSHLDQPLTNTRQTPYSTAMADAKRLHGRASGVTRATDRALLAQIADGDADAFEELYRRHADHAFMLARKLCASREARGGGHAGGVHRPAAHVRRSLPPRPRQRQRVAVELIRNRAIDAWRRAAVRRGETPVIEDERASCTLRSVPTPRLPSAPSCST